MGMKAKSPPQPAPQPYMGPGRNATEVNVRNHGYDGNLDDTAAINAFLSANYGGNQPGINDAPAKGTTAYSQWEIDQKKKQQAQAQQLNALPASSRAKVQAAIDSGQDFDTAMSAETQRQTQITGLAKDVGYYGDVGNGAIEDYLARNPDKFSTYQTSRQAIDPEYAFDPNTYSSGAKNARSAAETNAMKRVTDQGLNYGEFEPDIDSELDRIYKGISYGADENTASSAFDPNIADSVLGRIQTDRQSKYGNEVSNLFGQNYSTNAFADTADDNIISKILDEQYGASRDQVERSKSRGTLNPTGYDSALQELARQRSAGQSTLTGIGNNVLNTNRGSLDDIFGKAKQGASSYRLGTSFDPNSYYSEAENKRNELTGSLENDLRSNLGGQNLFDLSSVLTKAGSAQGAQNTGQSGVLDILAQRNKEKEQQRGVGTQGTF